MNINAWNNTGKIIVAVLINIFPVCLYPQDTTKRTLPDGTDGLVFATAATDSVVKEKPNEFIGPVSTAKIGLGYIHDFVAYSESKDFLKQMDSAGFNLKPEFKLRDFRILGSGVFKTKRYLAWKFAYMWDGDNEAWLVRESGVTIGVPEICGHIFIGRTKEGFSMVKVMNGHSPWAAERQMALDVIPILADGIKYFGYLSRTRIFWNLGAFNDIVSEGQKFSTYAWQYVARVGWMPFNDTKNNELMHIAANLRYGKPLDGKISLKSRPESNPTPQILNTDVFSAEHSSHIGAEVYYRNKRLTIGSEVLMHNFYTDEADNHRFYGGDVFISWFFTKTVRPYNTVGSVFGFVPVKRPVFKGGWGEWEGVLRFSMLDLNDRKIEGGKFWRITPMVNWYVTKVIRMEFVYGYGVLDKYQMKGAVQFFQSRIQFTLM
jgi:phosphate-selective porin OprO/OprP